MATLVITAPTAGSLKVQDGSLNQYYCNLKTVQVVPNMSASCATLYNSQSQLINEWPVQNIATIGSTTQTWGIQAAVDAIAALIITT